MEALAGEFVLEAELRRQRRLEVEIAYSSKKEFNFSLLDVTDTLNDICG
jgi:hypothetical protein